MKTFQLLQYINCPTNVSLAWTLTVDNKLLLLEIKEPNIVIEKRSENQGKSSSFLSENIADDQIILYHEKKQGLQKWTNKIGGSETAIALTCFSWICCFRGQIDAGHSDSIQRTLVQGFYSVIVCLSDFVYELDSRVDQNDLFWFETSTNQIASWIQNEKQIKMICFRHQIERGYFSYWVAHIVGTMIKIFDPHSNTYLSCHWIELMSYFGCFFFLSEIKDHF